MNCLPLIKAVFLSISLIIPTLQAMQKFVVDSKNLPREIRNRGFTPLHVAAYFGQADTIAEIIAAAGPKLML